MATGYTFKGKGSTQNRRLAVHKNNIHEQGGKMTGYNVALFVAQDEPSPFEPQSDTRVQYEVFDKDLAKETGNKKGVDSTVSLSKNQVDKIKEFGDHGVDSEYYVFDADVMFTERGAIPNTKTITSTETPFDKEKHNEVTQEARNSINAERAAKKEAKAAVGAGASAENDVEPDLEP